MAIHVLFLCTGNSARSILSEAVLNHLGSPRFVAYSGGSKPAGRVHPQSLAVLTAAGIPTAGLRSKNFDEFAGDNAPHLDLVITLCDSAQLDPCPVFLGDFVRAHWGLPDPAGVRGTPEEIAAAFEQTLGIITARTRALVALPVEQLDRPALAAALAKIADEHAPTSVSA